MTTRSHRQFTDLCTALVLGASSLQLASCARTSALTAAPSPPEVEVVTVEQRDIPIYREWIGTLDGLMNAAIRSQVTGYLLTQDYSEGSFVRKGQLLFTIDPRPLQAAVDQARGQLAQANGQLAQAQAQFQQSEAQLASAEANQRKAQFDENRYTPLAKENAVTQQDLDNAVQNNFGKSPGKNGHGTSRSGQGSNTSSKRDGRSRKGLVGSSHCKPRLHKVVFTH